MAQKMTLEARIAHFLKLAEDAGATQAERDTASAQAERLMLKHGIDEAALPTDQRPAERIIRESLFFGGAYGRERSEMFFRVVRALKLRGYQQKNVRDVDSLSGRAVNGIRAYVIGYESDVRSFLELIRSLDVQAAVGLKQWNREQVWGYWDGEAEKRVKRCSWLYGFGVGAAKRIEDSRRVIVDEAGAGTALALIDREREVDAEYRKLSLRGGRSSRRAYSGAAGSAGRSAGYSAGTGSRAVGGRLALGR